MKYYALVNFILVILFICKNDRLVFFKWHVTMGKTICEYANLLGNVNASFFKVHVTSSRLCTAYNTRRGYITSGLRPRAEDTMFTYRSNQMYGILAFASCKRVFTYF